MSTHSSERELYDILERQRGAFCQIAIVYFASVMIGLGLVTTQQATLGLGVLGIDIIFLTATTIVFVILAYYLHAPVEEIDKQIATNLKHIVRQGLPNEEGK